jgi:hypothetical protein
MLVYTYRILHVQLKIGQFSSPAYQSPTPIDNFLCRTIDNTVCYFHGLHIYVQYITNVVQGKSLAQSMSDPKTLSSSKSVVVFFFFIDFFFFLIFVFLVFGSSVVGVIRRDA